MPKMERLNSFLSKLKGLSDQGKAANVAVVVGYTQEYALAVHEDRQRYHPTGRAGYLLDVAREISADTAKVALNIYKKTMDMGRALLLAGLGLQRASQQEVPVQTGALRNSAFTRLED